MSMIRKCMRLGLSLRCYMGLACCALALMAAPGARAAAKVDPRAQLTRQIELINPAAVERALADMAKTWPGRIDLAKCRARLGDLATRRSAALKALANPAPQAEGLATAEALAHDVREILLANPLLDFDRLLLIRRSAKNLALPQNWESNSSIPRGGLDNAIMTLSGLRGEPQLAPLFQPEGGRFVGDLYLHFDGRRFLFSSLDARKRWGVFELDLSGGAPRQLPLIPDADVDNYSACYLADDSILFTSTAPFIGVPCVRGSSHVAHLYRYWPATGKIRRLTFDQEHNWCPTVLPDGRVMYLRWEYSDIPHFVARILFTMNPDGTNQRELYGSNSYWPNAFFFAKPMPGNPRKIVGVVGGHHGLPRMGELVILDPAKGRQEADGVVQRIPGWGKKVEPVIKDRLVDESWPRFLHPAPLSEKYIIAACQPNAKAPWGLYLVDVFDNMTLIKEDPSYALLEPVPLQSTPRPRLIPDAVKDGEKTARMQIVDIYQGPGLAGVPRGTVKGLRLFTYDFTYHKMGGQWDRVGLDGPWDVKRILGTVPVEPDGSAYFEVPANVPIAMQPLDAQGRALALMRSWTTAMPGETQSCLGCHERQNSVSAINNAASAMRKPPAQIKSFYGPLRGFSFEREVQPVLDRYCVSCHDGKPAPDGAARPDFTRRPPVFAGSRAAGYDKEIKFSPAYLALRAFVHTPTMESDMHLLTPCDFHASTAELVQLLEAGHHGVSMDREGWDRLVTWIDLNTPYYGTWVEMLHGDRVGTQRQRRKELLARYAGLDDDTETTYPGPAWKPEPAPAQPETAKPATGKPTQSSVVCEGWPLNADEARHRQQALGATTMTLDLGAGVSMTLVRVPAGRYINGAGKVVEIQKPFWMSATEVTNAQFARFNPDHDSRLENGDYLQFSVAERGWPLNAPTQPVCRVSWNEAKDFCRWLSARAGRKADLPAGAAWEYACRAGAGTLMSYGDVNADFSRQANLADKSFRFMGTIDWGLPSGAVPEWRPAVETVNDAFRVSAPVGAFQPNAWGLHDMHGNVWEWTLDATADGRRLARGGSWSTRPQRATANSTVAYQPWQKVYDVGFRVVIHGDTMNY